MSAEQCTEFPEPQDLKEILEIFDKLKDSVQAKKNVGPKLVEGIRKYCKDTDKFFKDSGSSGFLWNVFTNGSGIRKSILQNSRTFEKYNDLERDHAIHEDCVPRALKKCLPKAHAALLFMLFNCDTAFYGYSLGRWRDQKVNESGLSQDLHNWLTKEETLKPLTPGLIKRGFSTGNLAGSNTGQDVATAIAKMIKHDSAGDLQKFVLYLLLACPWDDALTGHALCFLYTFCSKVQGVSLEGKLKG
ncbi:hypothetical protein X943_003469 [Babesia divergens]|uniref:Uncharacterized protein n=1 Tax=Babesia divergens TaxID=32595 RepID=A0AAD9GJZ7_BABDI|nr:hypothetical protein X943_003469 [Babesia divergens]